MLLLSSIILFLFHYRERSIFEISSDKAYGPNGAGGVIPPDADLIFDIELLAVGDKAVLGFNVPGSEGSGCVLFQVVHHRQPNYTLRQ